MRKALATIPDEIAIARPGRLYQQVAQTLEQLIQRGVFNPGDRLPSEADLAKRFGVSRPVVREAMIVLETAGLVEVQNGNGSFVRAAARTMPLGWLRSGDLGPGPHEQFEVREILECEATARAALRITAEEIAELEALIAEMEQRIDEDFLPDRVSAAFHVALAKASGNSLIASIVEEMWRLRGGEMWRTIRARILKPEHRHHAIRRRREIVDALKRRDAKAARRAMHKMLQRAREMYFA